ncbi:VOC family protein [Ensifer aridi]|uniref:VOC family protein n=1 Tax=Ensifer aridi TaxID=1708715 RepID=UPI00358F274F
MRLNQVTVAMADLDAGWQFYCTLGLKPIVDPRPRYARFVCPHGDSTFSLHQGENGGGGTTIYLECENLDETVSNLKEAGGGIFPAGHPWRIVEDLGKEVSRDTIGALPVPASLPRVPAAPRPARPIPT